MSSTSQSVKPSAGRWAALQAWIDDRFPMTALWKEHASEYYAPKNFNFWYYFGVLSIVVLVIQIVTGIFLTMSYKPSAAEAFGSVEYIMRDVDWGWLIRYMHSTGASAFFIVASALRPLILNSRDTSSDNSFSPFVTANCICFPF